MAMMNQQQQQQRPTDARYLIVDIIDEAESAEVANNRKLSTIDQNTERDRLVIVLSTHLPRLHTSYQHPPLSTHIPYERTSLINTNRINTHAHTL